MAGDPVALQDSQGKSPLRGYYVKKVGQNRGAPRVWLEGSQVDLAGFAPGQRFDVVVEGQTVVLQANPDGSRIVSSKRIGERNNPVIDVNSRELLAVFDGMAAVRVAVKEGQIFLLPLASELKKQERYIRLRTKLENGEPLTIGSLSHGGGILSHAIHSGLAAAGVQTKMGFVNEIREELLEHARAHNDAWGPDTRVYAAPMQELAFDERGLATLPKVEILEAGLPCQGAAKSGKAKRGASNTEAHPGVGHLVVSALIMIGKVSPAFAIFENVPEYGHSASADILRLQLRDLGYVTHERVLNGLEWNTLENRNRWCMVAVSHGISFDFEQLMPPAPVQQRLGDKLEPIALDDPRWSRMQGLKDKEVRNLAEGSNFKMQVFTEDDPMIRTVTKGYSKVRSTDPKIQHPENPDLLRQLTPLEHANVKSVPPHLVDGLSATVAHEVLGQSIVYPPFRDVGHHIGNTLNRFAGNPEVPLESRVEAGGPTNGFKGRDLVTADVADIAEEILVSLQLADSQRGNYQGIVVFTDGEIAIQEIGGREGVVHKVADCQTVNDQPDNGLLLGEYAEIRYRDGQAVITAPERNANVQLGLFDSADKGAVTNRPNPFPGIPLGAEKPGMPLIGRIDVIQDGFALQTVSPRTQAKMVHRLADLPDANWKAGDLLTVSYDVAGKANCRDSGSRGQSQGR